MEFSTLKTIFSDAHFVPKWAINIAITNPDSYRDGFAHVLDTCLQDIKKCEDDGDCEHFFALYMLIKMRDKRAFAYLMRYATLQHNTECNILGDVTTELLPSMFISAYDGNLFALLTLTTDGSKDLYVRIAALKAIAGLYVAKILSKDIIIDIYTTLLQKYCDYGDCQAEKSKEYYDDIHFFIAEVVDITSGTGLQRILCAH